MILDVVYNHTGEGNETGPTYSFKGIDNATYYMTTGDESDRIAITPDVETRSPATPDASGHWY